MSNVVKGGGGCGDLTAVRFHRHSLSRCLPQLALSLVSFLWSVAVGRNWVIRLLSWTSPVDGGVPSLGSLLGLGRSRGPTLHNSSQTQTDNKEAKQKPRVLGVSQTVTSAESPASRRGDLKILDAPHAVVTGSQAGWGEL